MSDPAEIERIREIAASRGGEAAPAGGGARLGLRCRAGHGWESTPEAVRRGVWCPKCAGETLLDLDERRALYRGREAAIISKIEAVGGVPWYTLSFFSDAGGRTAADVAVSGYDCHVFVSQTEYDRLAEGAGVSRAAK